jgi:dipeptide/tripeptide permease
MQNIDPLAVIAFSVIIEYWVYEKLRSIKKMPSVLTRFFIGCMMGTISLICAMGVELVIMNSSDPENSVSIWWQTPQFCFIALGEIFLISTSYEVAFTYAPESLKAVSSGINLLFLAIASFISAGLFELCGSWMPDYDSANPSSWQNCHFDYYFIMLAVVCFVSGLGSLALNPYFNRNVKRPIDRERENSAHTVEMAINVQEIDGLVTREVTTVV